MSHLSTDRLAAIADETPTADEATHLAGCWDCRAEVAAYRRLARMAAMAPTPMEPLTAWSQLAPQLRAEGLIVDRGVDRSVNRAVAEPRVIAVADWHRTPATTLRTWVLRAAAAAVLVAGGAAFGRFTAPSAGLQPASLPADATNFASSDDAMRMLAASQQQYAQAAAYLAQQDTTARFIGMNEAAYQARLNALDDIAAATRAALYRTPQDPMLNQYYLTTLGAREATLRQIGATQPETRRLERY